MKRAGSKGKPSAAPLEANRLLPPKLFHFSNAEGASRTPSEPADLLIVPLHQGQSQVPCCSKTAFPPLSLFDPFLESSSQLIFYFRPLLFADQVTFLKEQTQLINPYTSDGN